MSAHQTAKEAGQKSKRGSAKVLPTLTEDMLHMLYEGLLKEIAFDKGLINKAILKDHIKNYKGNAYANYLKRKFK